MKIPHHALVALANGERLIIMRNVGQPFEPKLENVSEQDLLLTNFSAGVRHHEAANTAGSSSNIDELKSIAFPGEVGEPDASYCAIANIPPASECQAAVVLIGQFRNFTATSAMPP